MTLANPGPIDCCSPHTLRKLVTTLLSETRAIDLDYKLEESPKKIKSKLSVYDIRKLSGCLIRVPGKFYVTMWHILTKAQGGIRIHGQHMPRDPTISNMAR